MARLSLWATVAAATTAFAAGSIKDIEHVVLFMQENRAFDHYFGTMAGVRGFKDPNVQVNNGTSVFYQHTDAYQQSEYNTNATELLPWYLNYQGGRFPYTTQCMYTGSNSWTANHEALNGDLNDGFGYSTRLSESHLERSCRQRVANLFLFSQILLGPLHSRGTSRTLRHRRRVDHWRHVSGVCHCFDQSESCVMDVRSY